MSEWKTYKLGELCSKIGSGSTPKGGSNVYLESGEISLIRSQNIYNEGFNPNGIVYITQESADKLKNVIVNENDVLINITGDSVARACIVDKKYLPARVNQHTAILRAIPNILDYRYLKNYLINKPIQDYLLSISSSGATRNALTKSMLENLEIQLPDIETQQKIGEFLETFNKKIQLNTQANQTLEAIAQAIFKSWFVDFDPVRAKAQAILDGKTRDEANLSAMSVISGKAIEELSQTEYQELWEIADAFPSELVENSEFGEVPKGWEIVPLSTFGEIICGKTPTKSKAEYYGNDIPFIKIPDMHGKVFITQTIDNLSLIGADSQTKKYIPKGSICVSCIATVGLVSLASRKSQTNQQINSIIPNDLNFSEYLYLYLSQLEMNKYMKNLASGGSATLNMNTGTFSSIEILKPNENIICFFNEKIASLFEKILNNDMENLKLTQTRDLLLPKLLSGELLNE
ncbi:restriction endonuclease subunit S [Moraxella sp. Tifton1]|uniref:restriction endonuclease subunit S n=1 Tax=Moraxella oculi TaxID=2940516 RepID=UPI002013516F|nr:restriction endonuclease subunit S [Moraxella sp. Tifton1]MCL1624253.1 restriction endonuclease subunit S [Moraxella sp. Tifton1]